MSRYDGKRDVEFSVVEMHVSAANLRIQRMQQRCAGFERWEFEFPDFERGPGPGEDDCFDHG
jgi:hypothetical protein